MLLRHGPDDFVLTSAEPNLGYFADLVGRGDDVHIEDESEAWAVLALQGPRSRGLLAGARQGGRPAGLLRHHEGEDRRAQGHGLAHGLHGRRGLRGLGARRGRAPGLGCGLGGHARQRRAAVRAAGAVHDPDRGGPPAARRRLPQQPLRVDRRGSRDAPRDGPGLDAQGRRGRRPRFIGRNAIRRELADGTSRFRTTGLVVDWRDWDRVHDEAGLIPPKDHTPIQEEMYVYDDDGEQVGYATSFMYSPVLQRHIAIARVPLAAGRRPGRRSTSRSR